MNIPDRELWVSRWPSGTVQWVLLAFIAYVVIKWPFVWFFDTILTSIGFLYVYLWALPEATILYFVAFRLRARWTSTSILGLTGLIGAPIDYYYEWIVEQNLILPVFAFMYIPLFILRGLSADLSLMILKPNLRPARASMVSSFIFTVFVLSTTTFATLFFYPTHGLVLPYEITTIPWIKMGKFLIPYSIVTGTLGGYLGFSIAKDIKSKRA